MKNKIKSFFKKNPHIKIKSKDLAEQLEIYDNYQYAELKFYLHQLTKEGFLEKSGKRFQLNRYGEEKLISIVQIISEGSYGFVIMKNREINDVFIAGRNLNTAFDGDLVEVKLLERRRGKNIEGTIVKVIERSRKEIVGILQKSNSFYFVIPDDKKIHRDIYISSKNLNGAKAGDKVVVGNISWESQNLNPEGIILEVFGKAGSYDVEIASIARELELPYKFPDSVLKEAEKLTETIPESEIKRRIDLRNKIVFTIDPEDAKDFDDAVSIENLENGNFLLGIHIADVSHFAKEKSAIYNEALKRGTSIYLVGKVIPMLPEKLSNQICSLIPGKDRLTFSVLVEITKNGRIVSYDIKKSIINSKRRFTYEEVQKIIDSGKGEFCEQISLLNNIAKILKEKRIKKGSINFFTPEVVFKLDKNGKPLEINIKKIGESHNLIEELMLLANQIIAKHIQSKKGDAEHPFVYRVHDKPDKEKIVEFARFVHSLGYSFNPDSKNQSKEFQKLLDAVKGTEEEAVVNEIAIRSMAKAIYSTKNIGHYGLGFKYYTHFTSPIRRFPDLIVHNIIYNFIQNNSEKKYNVEDLEKICLHSSERERTAIYAERLSVKLKQIEYLESKVGEKFHGVVSGITNFGIFVELSQNLAEGLIRYRDMEDDYYILDEKYYSITGRKTGKRIRLGDKVFVKLIRLDKEKREIDFQLVNN